MMLDSTLGKILATKQVEPSVPANNEVESKSDPSKPDTSDSKPNEAEVRLVVKFIVEEQTIYNGKIERVKQLQIEELSRIVSTIDWKSVCESEDSRTSSEAKKIASCESQCSPTGHQEVNEDSQPNEGGRPSSVSGRALLEQQEQVQTHDQKSSELDAQLENQSIRTQKVGPETLISTDAEEQESKAHLLHSSLSECDNNFLSEHHIQVFDTDQRHELELRHRVNSINKQELVEKYITDVRNLAPSEKSPNYDDIDDDICLDSQTVTDTLNDCVNSVDLESRQENTVSNLANYKCENPDLSRAELPTHNEPTRPNDSPTELVPSGHVRDMVETARKNEKKTCSVMDKSSHKMSPNRNKVEQTYQEQDLKTSPCLVDDAPTMKKRPINDYSNIGKRMRRFATKDQIDPKVSIASKGLENSSIRLNTNSSQTGSTKSSHLIDNGQMLQEKIFAKWTDNHFYPGTILNQAKDQKFVVGFLDGAQRNVASTDMIPLSNIEGKQVRVTIAKNYCVNAIVHDQRSLENDQPMFDVEYQQDGKVRKCVPFKDIFLTGEQGTSLVNQQEKSSREKNASNFADVDLNNIMFAKRSRRLQGMDDFELTKNSPNGGKRKRSHYGGRNSTPHRTRTSQSSQCESPLTNSLSARDRSMQNQSNTGQEHEPANSPDSMKGNPIRPNSNSPSEGSNSTGSSNATNVTDIGQEFYFSSSSPHRTKTSVLL